MLPATSAATVMPQGMASGKFQGGMTTATPRGMCSHGVGLAGDVAAARLGQADHLPGVELAEVDCLGDVGVGLAPWLAALEDLPGRQLEAALPHDPGRLDQDRCAVAARVWPTRREEPLARRRRLCSSVLGSRQPPCG